MLVKFEALTSAVDKVKVLASDMKQGIPGVLLMQNESTLKVCYSDGHKAVCEIIEAEFEVDESFGTVIVPYETFIGIIDVCKPDGVVQVDNINVNLRDNNMIEVDVKKFVEQAVPNSEETINKTVSHLVQSVKFNRPEEDKRQSILTRMNYETMFEHEVFDTWNKAKLIGILKRLTKEDDKAILISSNKKAASVANLAYCAYIPCEDVINSGMCITSKIAKALIDILGKTNCDEVVISTENNQYCTIATSDDKVGIWFEMTKPTRMSITVIDEYVNKDYNSGRAIMLRPALANVIKCCGTISNGNEAIELIFKTNEDGNKEMKFNGIGSASKSGDFAVEVAASTGDIDSEKYGINLTCLLDMVSLCNEDYVAFDFLCDERGKFLRIADIAGKNEDGTISVSALYYTTVK